MPIPNGIPYINIYIFFFLKNSIFFFTSSFDISISKCIKYDYFSTRSICNLCLANLLSLKLFLWCEIYFIGAIFVNWYSCFIGWSRRIKPVMLHILVLFKKAVGFLIMIFLRSYFICLILNFRVLLEVKGSTLTSGARALSKHVNRSYNGWWGSFGGSGNHLSSYIPLLFELTNNLFSHVASKLYVNLCAFDLCLL